MQYKARILGLMEGKDPVAVQRGTAQQLADLVDGIPAEKLRERPASGKWSVASILAHLAEAEVSSTWRYRQMIERDGTPLPGFDQDLWETLGEYSSRDPQGSLQLFRLLRQANLQMFDKLTPDEWQRHGIHAERGPMSVRDLAVQIAGHDINHVAQIRTILGK
jgi:DinB superfamily